MVRKTRFRNMRTCFRCGKNIESVEDRSYIALDRPCIMLIFHKECIKKIKRIGEEKWLIENKQRIFDLYAMQKQK